MTNKQKIVEFMKGKGNVSVKDIQAGLPEIKPTCVWGCIASNECKIFQKVSRGVYTLKVAEVSPQVAQEMSIVN